MPAIETLLTGPVAATEPAGTPPETTSGGADDFEQAMQQALAPGGKKLPEKTAAPPMGRSLPPTPSAGETLPAEFLAVENPSEKSAPSAEKKTDETPAPKLADALNPTPVLWLPPVDYSMPPGVSLLLPSSGDFPAAAKAALVTGEKSGAQEIMAALPGVAGKADSPSDSKVAARLPETLPAGAADKVLPPVLDLVAEKIASPVPEKIAPKLAGPDAGQINPAEKISGNKMEPAAITSGKNLAGVAVPQDGGQFWSARTSPGFETAARSRVGIPPESGDVSPPARGVPSSPEKNLASAVVPAPVPTRALIESPPVNLFAPGVAAKADVPAPAGVRGKLDLSQPPVFGAPEKNPASAVVLPPGRPVTGAESPPVNLFAPGGAAKADVPAPAGVRGKLDLSRSPMFGAPEKNPASALVPPPALTSARVESLPVNLFVPGVAPKADLAAPAEVRGKLDLSQPPVVTVAAVNTGTGVASTVPEMKNSDKVDFFAGLTGQKLPEAGPARSVAAALSSLPEFPAHASGKFSSEFAAPFAGAGTGSSSVSSAEATTQMNVLALPSLTEARLNTVERAHDLVSLHALRLVETRADAMSVVLKPGAGTELSLELRQRNGVIEASAVLAQGDYQLLNQHWADLQARLELRGIKLGPLGGEAGFNSGGGNFSQQRSPARDEETERAAAFAEFAALAGGASARRMPALRGWESWA